MAKIKAQDPRLLALIAKINKEHGSGAVLFGSELRLSAIHRISAGSLAIDVQLGGGWAVNQWHEILGHESAGKSTIIMKTIAANQALDPAWTVWWVASEPFDAEFARLLGCDTNRIIIHDTNVMEEAYDWILSATRDQLIDCVVIDSYPALVSEKEDEGVMGDAQMGIGARLTNQFFRKQGSTTRRSLIEAERPVTCFFVNQWREKIGVVFGDPRTTPGGKGKNFAVVTRVEVKRGKLIEIGTDDAKEAVGQTLSLYTMKNKTGRPFRRAEVDFYFADLEDHPAGSYDSAKELVNVGIGFGVLRTADGRWFEYDGRKMNGRKGVRVAMGEDPALRERMTKEIMDMVTHGRLEQGVRDA